MNNFTQSSRERITLARTNLVIDHPFFGVLALRLRIVEDNTMPTAYTDGSMIGYNDAFIRSLTMAQLMFVIAHEVMHCAMGHQWRIGARQPERWNYAADYSINPIINDAKAGGSGLKLEMPPDCLFDEKYKGKSAEWIYSHLQDKKNAGGSGQKKGKGKAGGGAGSVPGGCNCDGVRPAQGGDPSESEWRVMANHAAAVARQAGKLPGALAGFVEGLNEAQIDWRAAMRRFVQESALRCDYTWKRPNPRYTHIGGYLPSLRGEQTPPIAVAFDTSGSVSDKELAAFITELQSIIDEVQPAAIHFIQCDAKVQSHEELGPEDVLGKVKISGRGGTRFEPVFEHVEREGLTLACLVYLTDLCGSFPKEQPGYPTLWVSVNKQRAPFGETIYLNDCGSDEECEN